MVLTFIMLFGLGVSCRILYSFVSYLYVSRADHLSRLGKRELICLLLFSCNYVVFGSERFPLPLGAWDGLRYFIVVLPGPSI